MTRIHHLNCGSHCLLVELESKLVLVDTGVGLEDVRAPRARLSPLFLYGRRPRLHEDCTAVRQITTLGFRAEDVTDIALTHLDCDNAGGLDDFPNARVHLFEAERDAAIAQRTFLDRQRFRPQQWSTFSRWQTYAAVGEPWFGFPGVRELEGLPPEILLVPLVGHTLGHAGVAIRREEEWYLLAGDAYFHRGEMAPSGYRCTRRLRFFQWLMDADRRMRLENQERLRELVKNHSDEVRVFSSFDPVEFAALRATALSESVRRSGIRRQHLGVAAAEE
jgi:glyoxylase-like metal-dependent hydrolase (beta-lactamase superfamily II)